MFRSIILMSTVALTMTAATAMAEVPKIPAGAKPLTEAQIRQLLDGKTYSFVAFDDPTTGTGTWNYAAGTVSGNYVWKKTEKGTFTARWFIKDGRNCTQQEGKAPVCEIIYADGDGFIEVNADNSVHAVSKPGR